MNKVFIINGAARHGKDSFVEFFGSNCAYNILNISTIDPVRQAMNDMGIPSIKDDKWRKFAHDLKNMSDEHYNISFNYVMCQLMYSHTRLGHTYAFVHCREPEKILKLKKMVLNKFKIPCETILIQKKSKTIPDNNADKEVENFKYIHYITNNGTLKQLENKAKTFYNKVNGVK